MGKCFSSEDRVTDPPKPFNDFFYLCRDLKYLVRISPSNISKFKYEKSVKIRKDSGVGYLSDGRIFVAGGTDSSGCLTNTAYLLDPARSKVTVLPSLPVSCKEGNLFHYKDCVFYIGGIKDSDDEDILAQEQTAPIMKYYLTTGQWEVFDEQKPKTNFQDYLKNNSKAGENTDRNLRYSQVLYPGMFMIGSKVYLVNGQIMSSRGILTTMDTVFSLDLEQDDFSFKVEKLKSPLDAFRPTCGSYSKTGFITGGLKHNSKNCSMASYVIEFDQPDPVFTQVPGLKLDIDDFYPILGSDSSFISVAFPNLAIFDRQNKVWFQYKIEQNLVPRSGSKKETPFLKTDEVAARPHIKTNTVLTAKNKRIRIVSDDVPSGESLSQLDGSLNIELPPGLIIENPGLSRYPSISSNSSNTFSVEKRIPLPEPLRKDLASSESHSNKKEDQVDYHKNRPIVDLTKGKNKPQKKQRGCPNQISVPVLSESDSVVSNVYVPVKDQSVENSFSESFRDDSSEMSERRMVPMKQKMAPIKQGMGLMSREVCLSESSLSDSFAYEDYK